MRSKKVAVVGGGFSGLVAIRELCREGHEVVAFERGAQLGGTWVYSPETESDPLGIDPTRTVVHSSLYDSLRTNLPRHIMGFREFPFVDSGKPGRDSRRYPKHEEVLRYLEDFACEYGLKELIRFQTEVLFVGLEKDGKWTVKSRRKNTDELEETFDAVVICCGHNTEPRIADIPDVEVWPGWQCHSHSYRTPEAYRDQVVIVIGASASAIDISRDIAGVAKEIHVVRQSEGRFKFWDKFRLTNMFFHPMIDKAYADGRVGFQDGTEVIANVILHCTGYKHHYPFLHTDGAVNVDDNRVGPLYKHVFPPALAPGIAFVGIPNFVITSLHFELQSKWIAGILSERISLPSEEEMMQDVETLYSKLEASNVPKRHTHMLGDFLFELEDWLAKECGCPAIEEWRKNMFKSCFASFIAFPKTYRDEPDCSEELYEQAEQEFRQVLGT
ncbi:hypothetical protein RND81_06G231800 [Saponaria officinalis]|uniref:Flavin-containing monooxygenase n=1 Tax=Saponaria officinalis TaxID=3572 RepID=A0AAW1KDF4_SAPOF